MNYLNKFVALSLLGATLAFSCNNATKQSEEANSEEVVVSASDDKAQPSSSSSSNSASAKKETSKPTASKPKPQAKPVQFAIQKGTSITVKPVNPISTDEVVTGDNVQMTVAKPIIVNSQTVVPAGAIVKAKVVLAKKQKTLGGRSKLHIELTSVKVEGKTYALSTDTFELEGKSNTGKTAAKAGGGAAAGAAIGALAGKKGNKGKGAAIGAGVGAAAGLGAAALQKKGPAVIEEAVSFTTQETTQVTVTLMM